MVHRHMLYLSLRYLPVCVYICSILVDYVLCPSLESTRSGLGDGAPWSYVLVHRCRILKLLSCIYVFPERSDKDIIDV